MRLYVVRPAIAALPRRRQIARRLALAPADRARRADREAGRRLAPREAAIDDGDDTFTKIERQRMAHACRPPRASMKLESGSRRFGNPTTILDDGKML